MSPYVEEHYHDEPGTSALAMALIVLLIIGIFAAAYFLWYAPAYQGTGSKTNVRVTIPGTQPNQPPSAPPPSGGGQQGGGTAPQGGSAPQGGTAPQGGGGGSQGGGSQGTAPQGGG